MRVKKIAEGAYFVQSYSLQNITINYDPTTSQQVLSSSREKEKERDKTDTPHLDPDSNPLSEMRSR